MYVPRDQSELSKEHNERIAEAESYFAELEKNHSFSQKNFEKKKRSIIEDKVETCIAIASVDRAPHKYPICCSSLN